MTTDRDPAMAALRALLIFAALIAFFLVGAPLQWLLVRFAPRASHVVPVVFCRSLLGLLAVRILVTGERASGAPVLIASNHISWIDILALGGIMPFCFLAKSEVSRWPMVSAFAGVQGTVFVDRNRRRSIPKANRELATRMLEGRVGLLFPEATTLAGPEPGPFHTPHFAVVREVTRIAPDRPTVLVQPVAIAYSSPAAAWVGDENLMAHLWRTLRSPPLTCRIAFGAPIACGAAEDRKRVARQTREAIVGLLAPAAVPMMSAVRSPIVDLRQSATTV